MRRHIACNNRCHSRLYLFAHEKVHSFPLKENHLILPRSTATMQMINNLCYIPENSVQITYCIGLFVEKTDETYIFHSYKKWNIFAFIFLYIRDPFLVALRIFFLSTRSQAYNVEGSCYLQHGNKSCNVYQVIVSNWY